MRKNAIILFAVLLALASASAAQEGDWNYVLKTDGTARLTRYVGLGEPAEMPETVDDYAVTEASRDLTGRLPAGAAYTKELPQAAGVTEDGLRYALSGEGAVILGYEGDAERVIVPRQIESQPVTRIADGAFRENWSLTHVLLPDTLLEIGDNAFRSCRRLEQVHFDRGVRVIGEYAFYDCAALTRLTLPTELMCVGAYAFACTPLTRVSLPDSVQLVGESAFDHNTAMGYVRMGSSVRVIERFAFAEAPIRRVKLPESVKRIGRGAFAATAYLTAENSDLKAALPELEITKADLTARSWPEPEPEAPLVQLEVDVPLGSDEDSMPEEAEAEASREAERDTDPESPAETEESRGEEPKTPEAGTAAEELNRQEKAAGPMVRITASIAKLRSGPGGEYYLIQYAAPGDTFPYEGHYSSWYRLKLPDGQTAYVARGMAEVIGR